MTAAEFHRVLRRAHVLHRDATRLAGLEEAIAAIDRADAIGPVVDPTLYRAKAQVMGEDRQVLLAVRELGRLGGTRG